MFHVPHRTKSKYNNDEQLCNTDGLEPIVDLACCSKLTLFAVEGKDAETSGVFKTELQRKGGDSAKIKLISMDISATFICGRNEYFSKAEIVFDKFHLVQYLNQALDDVRKAEHRNCGLLIAKQNRFAKYEVKKQVNFMSQVS